MSRRSGSARSTGTRVKAADLWPAMISPSMLRCSTSRVSATDVPDVEREQLLRRAQAGVSDGRDHRRRVELVGREQLAIGSLDLGGPRRTITRWRRPDGFSTCCTGFSPGTQRQRIACLNMLCRITSDTRTA